MTSAGSIPRRRRLPSARDQEEPIESRAFEAFLVSLSDAFVQRPAAQVLPLLHEWLTKLAELIAVDRIALWEISEDGRTIVRRFSYTLPGCEPPPLVVPAEQFAWLIEHNRHGKVVAWSRVPDDVPKEACNELEYTERIHAKSMLSIPIAADGVVCVLAFTCLREYRYWSRTIIRRLRLVCSILAGAVIRERAEAKSRAIVEAVPDMVFALSPSGIYLECHCRDSSELLLPPEQFLGRSLEEVLPTELAATFRAAIARVHEGAGVEVVEYELMLENGRHEYEARMVRRDDGAVVSIVRDVTQRRRGARLLRESEARFRGAFQNSAIGMAIVGLDGRWIRANPATCRILGYSEDELRAMNFQELTHPDDLQLNTRELQRVVRGEIDHYQFEKRYIHKDGRIVPASLTASVVRDDGGRPLHFVSQLQDLTEQRKAQVEIERLRIELARFGRAALTGQLSAALAHQLMQPLAAAIGNAQACKRMISAARGDSNEVRHALEDIERSCTRAVDIVNGVRKMLRKEPGPRSHIDFNELVREVLDLMRTHLALRRVTLLTELQSGLPPLSASPIELQQVVLNLVLNAAEALEGFGGRRTVRVATATSASRLDFSVSDSGPGLSPDLLPRIFEPFFTTKSEGIGMGLTICADIVHAHEGEIRAVNNDGGGLTVHCMLPLESGGSQVESRDGMTPAGS